MYRNKNLTCNYKILHLCTQNLFVPILTYCLISWTSFIMMADGLLKTIHEIFLVSALTITILARFY